MIKMIAMVRARLMIVIELSHVAIVLDLSTVVIIAINLTTSDERFEEENDTVKILGR